MARDFSRAMEQAAKDTGVDEVANDLKKVTSPKSMGLDAMKGAADRFEKWDPLKNAAKPTSPTGRPHVDAATHAAHPGSRRCNAATVAARLNQRSLAPPRRPLPSSRPSGGPWPPRPPKNCVPQPKPAPNPPQNPHPCRRPKPASKPASKAAKPADTAPPAKKAAAAKPAAKSASDAPAKPSAKAATKPVTKPKTAAKLPRRPARNDMTAHQDDIDDSSAPLIEHLAELRNRILYSLAAFIVAMVLCFTVWNPIFNFLTHPICDALRRTSAGLRPCPDQAARGLLRRRPHLGSGRLCPVLPGDRLPDVALCGPRPLSHGKTGLSAVPPRLAHHVLHRRGLRLLHRPADRLRFLPELPAELRRRCRRRANWRPMRPQASCSKVRWNNTCR